MKPGSPSLDIGNAPVDSCGSPDDRHDKLAVWIRRLRIASSARDDFRGRAQPL
jgi:hypothetical protein